MRIIILTLCLAAAAVLPAVETRYFEFKGADGFADPAVVLGTGIHSRGYLTQTPRITKLFETGEGMLWSVVRAGDTIYAGSGETGRILYFIEGGEQGVLTELGKFSVKALAADNAGILYAGGPDGTVCRFPDILTQEPFFSTGEKYVWSIVFDADNTCYIGTGPEGRIFKVNPDGTGALLVDTEAKHILTMVLSNGRLFAGTSDKGLIYRIDCSAAKAEVLKGLPGTDVIALAIHADRLLAITGQGEGEGEGEGDGGEPNLSAGGAQGGEGGSGSVIHRIAMDTGASDIFFTAPRGEVISLAVLTDGTVAAGTDSAGLVYLVTAADDYTATAVADVGKVLGLTPDGDGFLAATEQPGCVCRAAAGDPAEGEYISRVCVVPEVEQWGIAAIEARVPSGAAAAFALRSGASPDTESGWSDWQELTAGDIKGIAPGHTYLQLKAVLKAPSLKNPVVVRRIGLAFLPVNHAPEIALFQQVVPGQAGGPPVQRVSPNTPVPPGESRGANGVLRGMVPLMWQAADPDSDPLLFSVEALFENETHRQILAEYVMGDNLALDTAFMPEGRYRLMLTASDEDANADGLGFAAEFQMDETLTVDRTPPAVSEVHTAVDGDHLVVTCTVSDLLSRIRLACFNINGGDWITIAADDRIVDELEESFAIAIARNDLQTGDAIVLRFDDEADNYRLVRIVVPE